MPLRVFLDPFFPRSILAIGSFLVPVYILLVLFSVSELVLYVPFYVNDALDPILLLSENY